ncbi:diguanylate cyclase [Maridesulfovibrio hydrothermalis]|uniref:Putative Diguanylate cyclase n=1 Tax=Maridesulfovibrio hydrothermalis AM13 = DSM 14728 TaxID=1121451 RepID=L0RBH0_9BACT|nr:diguanylate cyclase [Maridesulfovibrio hydrothermalis]CCO22896.1 putative Diguanylate cyclase [Maridesulfovibrio hydrothermalis AM13 = DSM 14728]
MQKGTDNKFILAVCFACLVALLFFATQHFIKLAVKRNEVLFNDNQFDQSRIIADALTREVACLTSTSQVLAHSSLARFFNGTISGGEVESLFGVQIKQHDTIDGYVYFNSSGRIELEAIRSASRKKVIEDAARSFNRGAWFEFSKSSPKPYLTFSHANSKEQLLGLVFPVRVDSRLKGILIQVINLKPLIKLYISPLRSGEHCAGFLISSRGVVIYDHDPEIIGKNIFQGIHNEYPEVLALDRRLVTEDSGQAEYLLPIKRKGKSIRKLISWNAARIGSQKYVVCIAVPAAKITGIITDFKHIYFLTNALVLLALGLGLYTFIRRRAEQKIRENGRRLVLALEGNRDGIWDWNIKTSEVYFSPRLKEMLGFTEEEMTASVEEWKSRVHPGDADKVSETINNHIQGNTPFYESEHRVRCKDGSYKWILDRGKIYSLDEGGKPERMIGTRTDVTEKKRIELEIRKLSLAVESSPSAVVITDTDGMIEYVNRSFEEITKYSSAEAIGKNPSELIKSDSQQADIYEDLWKTISSGKVWRGELVNRTKFGENYWCRLSISPVYNDLGTIINYVGIQEDLTELKKKELALKQLATTDELTGINNRRNFMEMADQEMRRTKRKESSMSVSILDIDHFKRVNDTYGHGFGDFVLKEMAALIQDVIREMDIFGRIGGEEFALILPDTEAEGAFILLERLRGKIENYKFKFHGVSIIVTASFGYTVFDGSYSESLTELMKHADRALYAAKAQGRNRVVFAREPESH